MTDRNIEFTRRKALLGLGTIGVAGAGAGVGTSALFSDEESFDDNSITAGTLDLVLDYYTSVDSSAADAAVIDGGTVNNGQIQGGVSAQYVLNDVKPGDGGTLAFCPKVIDNPAYISVSSDGVTDFENGQTEPEQDADHDNPLDISPSPDLGSLNNGTNDGAGYGELSEAIEVTVSYAESVTYDSADDEITCNNTRELNNPQGYTLNDLITDLGYGFPLDGNEPNDGDDNIDPYPASSDTTTQQGPCLCVEWEIPSDVGNEIQSDALKLDFTFAAEQARNNDAPATVVYNDFYNHFNGVSPVEFIGQEADGPTATWAYAANNATGFGGIVGLGSDGAPGFELTSGAVIMSNWYGWDPSGGVGNATSGYTHPFTLELYEVDSGPAPGQLIAEVTEDQDVPGRELPDGSNEDYSMNGTNFLMEWDLGGVTVNSDKVLFIVSFEITGSNQTALQSMNIASYDVEKTSEITAGYSANDDIWWRADATSGNISSFDGSAVGGVQGGGQVMSRFEGRPL
ncbi:SipW-dependent-type signal peptide-containing protein [Halobaculum gomorrense]|uniref:SipW-cognate class signal peptide n=1 Tax=Halobaculum gomorrense TaxID=43928 RepID=A0A1M5UF89_9EURY|nr:SipW-dependent-type signal peptide-containing protein [Halobaculum gomorrense]SHH61571.1 SipW-cognate class signal peptide [Halobaculum gomorrense]